MKRRLFKAFPYSSILIFIFWHSTAVQAGSLIHARTQKRRWRRFQQGFGWQGRQTSLITYAVITYAVITYALPTYAVISDAVMQL